MSAVVRLFIGVTDAKYFLAASRARFAIASVNCHTLAESSDLLGKGDLGFVPQVFHPEFKGRSRGSEQALPFVGRQFLRQCNRRQLGGMQNLVRVGVAN